MPTRNLRRPLAALIGFLFLSAVYLFAFPQTNLFYGVMVILHVLAGILTCLLLVPLLWTLYKEGNLSRELEWLVLPAGALLGIFLIFKGTRRADWNWLYAHIVLSTMAVGLL